NRFLSVATQGEFPTKESALGQYYGGYDFGGANKMWVDPRLSKQDYQRTLAHESTHLLFNRLTGSARIPLTSNQRAEIVSMFPDLSDRQREAEYLPRVIDKKGNYQDYNPQTITDPLLRDKMAGAGIVPPDYKMTSASTARETGEQLIDADIVMRNARMKGQIANFLRLSGLAKRHKLRSAFSRKLR
ncbi:unnamed protein product, partial [marine sediment metagenome]